VIDKLSATIHLSLVTSHLIKDYLWRIKALLLPIQATSDRPVEYAWQFFVQFTSKVFVPLFGSKGTTKRNSVYAPPDTMISVVYLRQTIGSQEYLPNYT
tara:strand:+ start:238 stop:534 length:297 start_codon:yes stop_codon:yes gene_type:complete